MKGSFYCFFMRSFFPVCNIREREQQLQQQQVQLTQKELELESREKALQSKEEELVQRERILDSTLPTAPKDTGVYKAGLVGLWTVK